MSDGRVRRDEWHPGLRIGIASADQIRSWSFGEVKRPETIDRRNFRAVMGGLFCERIFGPERDWECFCGKYKGIKHKGIICDRCGVKVTLSSVRRKRMGHIELAAPVVHRWFIDARAPWLGLILDMSARDLRRVIYDGDYVVFDPGSTPLPHGHLLRSGEYDAFIKVYGPVFEAKSGAEAIRTMLQAVDIREECAKLRSSFALSHAKRRRAQLSRRIRVLEAVRAGGFRLQDLVLDAIPVIPPDQRPIMLLESGNLTTGDLNALYRRVLERSSRIKKLRELRAPERIMRTERSRLQMSVDQLFDNGRTENPVLGAGRRPRKSLTAMLEGKRGRFRQDLLGKRVDYSGRSVTVVGPELKLHQCGLPKKIALELFRPFIIRRLKELGHADTIKSAKKMLESREEVVWDILEEVIQDHPVLLSRAPPVHRVCIQAFEPVLVEFNAIGLHPLVCDAFGVDLDGDEMTVHLPLSLEAQVEATTLLMSTRNIFSPAHGDPVITPSRDMLLGIKFLTGTARAPDHVLSESTGGRDLHGCERVRHTRRRVFADIGEVLIAHGHAKIDVHSKILLRIGDRPVVQEGKSEAEVFDGFIETTPGRAVFNAVIPAGMPYYNHGLDEESIARVIRDCRALLGTSATVRLLDSLKTQGFEAVTRAGLSMDRDDDRMQRRRRDDLTAHAQPRGRVSGLEFLRAAQAARRTVIGARARRAAAGYLMRKLAHVAQNVVVCEEDCGTLRGISVHVGDQSAMSLAELIRGRCARDTVIDVLTDEVVVEEDGLITAEIARAIERLGYERLRVRSPLGCDAAAGVCARCYGEDRSRHRLVEEGTAVGIIAALSVGEVARRLAEGESERAGDEPIIAEACVIRSRHTGTTRLHGLCVVATSAGILINRGGAGRLEILDPEERVIESHRLPLGAELLVCDGESVQPGSALCRWDTDVASTLSGLAGVVRFEGVFHGVNVEERVDGAAGTRCTVVVGGCGGAWPCVLITDDSGHVAERQWLSPGAELHVSEGERISAGTLLARVRVRSDRGRSRSDDLARLTELFEARRPDDAAVLAELNGAVAYGGLYRGHRTLIVLNESGPQVRHVIPDDRVLRVAEGETVRAGDRLTLGGLDPNDLLRIRGEEVSADFLIGAVQCVLRARGHVVDDAHIETIVRCMLRNVLVDEVGDTDLIPGSIEDVSHYCTVNRRCIERGCAPASARPVLLGITKAALHSDSFLL